MVNVKNAPFEVKNMQEHWILMFDINQAILIDFYCCYTLCLLDCRSNDIEILYDVWNWPVNVFFYVKELISVLSSVISLKKGIIICFFFSNMRELFLSSSACLSGLWEATASVPTVSRKPKDYWKHWWTQRPGCVLPTDPVCVLFAPKCLQ